MNEMIEEPEKGSIENYLTEMPKAELHIHLEGSLSPETIVRITHRNQLDYFRTIEEVQESLANRPPGLMGFLEHHFKSQEVMQTPQDFYDATTNLIKTLNDNKVVYVDLFFDPQVHTSRGIQFGAFFEAIDAARRDARKQHQTEVQLIMCANRERSVEGAFEMLDQAQPYKDKILGFGLDSGPEYGNPPIKFKDVFAHARGEGYFITAHHDVDVRDSVKHMWQSMNVIQIDRIDHGLNSLEDPALIQAFIEQEMCLTGSPVKRSTDPDLQDVARITALDKAGVCVSIHSDDPEEFDSGYLTNMLILFQRSSGYSKADMTRLMLNAFKGIWIEPQRTNYISQLKRYAEASGVSWSAVLRQ